LNTKLIGIQGRSLLLSEIEIDPKETGYADVDWVQLILTGVLRRSVEKMT